MEKALKFYLVPDTAIHKFLPDGCYGAVLR